jgi:hypothetical protein
VNGDQYPADEVVRATVEAVNERGAKLTGVGWCNFSKFGNVAPPAVGDEVEATLRPGKQGGYWIQGLRPVGDAPAGSDRDFGTDAPEDDLDPSTFGYDTPARGSGAAPRPVAAKPVPAKPAGKATLKAAALASAAHFLSSKPEATEDAVYDLAYRFLAWIEEAD